MATAGTERLLIDASGHVDIFGGDLTLRNSGNTADAITLNTDGSTGRLSLLNGGTETIRLRSSAGQSFINLDLAIGQNAAADASSILELESTTEGFLTPRMTIAQRDAIGTPATGLLVFATDAGDNGIVQF